MWSLCLRDTTSSWCRSLWGRGQSTRPATSKDPHQFSILWNFALTFLFAVLSRTTAGWSPSTYRSWRTSWPTSTTTGRARCGCPPPASTLTSSPSWSASRCTRSQATSWRIRCSTCKWFVEIPFSVYKTGLCHWDVIKYPLCNIVISITWSSSTHIVPVNLHISIIITLVLLWYYIEFLLKIYYYLKDERLNSYGNGE